MTGLARLPRRMTLPAAVRHLGIVATAVALVIFNVLVHGVTSWFDGPLHDRPLTSYLLANSVGMFVSYYGSRHYAFRHRHAAGPGGGLPRYVAINLASFVIPVSCLWLTRHVLHWDSIYADNISGNVVGAVLGAPFRFWAFRRFVFHTAPVVPRPFWESAPGRGKHGVAVEEAEPDFSEVDP